MDKVKLDGNGERDKVFRNSNRGLRVLSESAGDSGMQPRDWLTCHSTGIVYHTVSRECFHDFQIYTRDVRTKFMNATLLSTSDKSIA